MTKKALFLKFYQKYSLQHCHYKTSTLEKLGTLCVVIVYRHIKANIPVPSANRS